MYVNPRFGTAVEVPADGFKPNPAPENGDGQSWVGDDGYGFISVFASHIIVAEDFAGYRAFTLDAAREEGIGITYTAGEGNWFVYSGKRAGNIVYEKAILAAQCPGVAHHVRLEYPEALRETYEPIVEHMAASLRASRGVDCD